MGPPLGKQERRGGSLALSTTLPSYGRPKEGAQSHDRHNSPTVTPGVPSLTSSTLHSRVVSAQTRGQFWLSDYP